VTRQSPEARFFSGLATCLDKPGLHLEGVYARPAQRGIGISRATLRHLA
jgi:hypothetical protein